MSRDVIGVFSVGWLMCWALGSASCVSATDYTPLPPSVPKLRLPRNDVYEGSVITGSLRPRFVWEASTANTSGAITYELQLSADPKLEADVTTVTIAEPSYQPDAALPVSTVPPVGRRYYWRVRACLPKVCSEFSPTWWVNLGRSSKDFNGDGYADVAVGSTLYQSRGAVLLYFGGPGPVLDTAADGLLDVAATGDDFGMRIAAGGDFNGDGFGDLVISSFKKVYLFFGGAGSTFNNAADVIFQGEPTTNFGQSITLGGDLNADGFSDITIGDPGNSALGQYSGRVYVYLGGVDGTLDMPDGTLSGRAENQAFGNYMSCAGDTNGDGFADLVISSGAFNDDIHKPCQADIYFGRNGQSFATLENLHLVANTTDYCTSRSVIAGDLNRDGFSDILTGIGNSSLPDRVEILLGGETPDAGADAEIDGVTEQFNFLNHVTTMGDVNGDGYDDVAVIDGEDFSDTRIYLGRISDQGAGVALPAAGILPIGTAAIRPAGDVNGDGYDDVIVGDVNQSQVRIYFGGPGGSFDITADWILSNPNGFGSSVAVLERSANALVESMSSRL
jgi:FG-GAP repeat